MASHNAKLAQQPASPSLDVDEQDYDDEVDEDDTANDMTEIIAGAQRAESNGSSNEQSSKAANGNGKSKSKDALRPRRKKARRACLACQRAHLTCGEL
jgi:hypothetical protein